MVSTQSPTAMIFSTSMPISFKELQRKEEFVSTISPRRTSSPVERIYALIINPF